MARPFRDELAGADPAVLRRLPERQLHQAQGGLQAALVVRLRRVPARSWASFVLVVVLWVTRVS